MGSDRKKVSIIIPHYNQKECLERLLPCVANQTYDDYEVIIIDDCTPDRSVPEYIKSFIKDHQNIRLVENSENLGFVKTVNKGITLANGEYVCLLNHDTEVTSDFVERNVEIMDADSSIGALSCIIVDSDVNNWFSGGRFNSGFPVNLKDDFQGIRPVDFVAGTAPFYRRKVFDMIGLFDENYRMYHEDVEFGLRIRAKTEYKACIFSDKLVTHYLVPSIPKGDLYYFLSRNHMLLLKTYSPRYIPKMLLYYLRQIANLQTVSMLRLDPKYMLLSLHTLRGTVAGLTGWQNE